VDEVSPNAKKDDDVKHEAKERGRPFLNRRYAVNMDTGGVSVVPLRDNTHKHVF
jgi:hypothetical protein